MTDTGSRPQFRLDVSVPRDPRFVPTVRDLAVHAARFAGCNAHDADAFGHSVETVLGDYLRNSTSDAPIAIVVRHDDGPLQVLVNEQTISLDL